MKKDSIPYVVAFTFAVSAFFVTGLALANEGTKGRVAANRELASKKAVLDALGAGYRGDAGAVSRFGEAVRRVEGEAPPAYRATVDGADYVVVEQTGPGLWGAITIVLAADPAGERIRGVRIVAQNETPGLGGRIEEPGFLGQFRGEAASGGVRVAVGAETSGGADTDPDNGRVDGIAGASRTSASFEAIVNAALARARSVAGGTR